MVRTTMRMAHMSPVFEAFRLYDQEGLPLSVLIEAARAAGLMVNLAAFTCDALVAGWTEDRVAQVVGTACRDNGLWFDWPAFRAKLASLWVLCGSLPDPECWSVMKQRLIPE